MILGVQSLGTEGLSGIEMENIIRLGFVFVATECCWAGLVSVSSSYLVDARPRHGKGNILMCSQRVLLLFCCYRKRRVARAEGTKSVFCERLDSCYNILTSGPHHPTAKLREKLHYFEETFAAE